jgi:hypothetical protein
VPDYPNDADGDALRRIANDGSDMSQPMEVDFTVDVGSSNPATDILLGGSYLDPGALLRSADLPNS